MPYDRQKYLEALKVQLEPNIFNHREKFIEICLLAMQGIAKEIGL